MIILTTLAIGLAGLLVLLWLGYAAARWLLPVSLRAWWLLLAPLLGYAVFVVVAQVGEQVGVTAPLALLATLLLATVLNALVWWRERGAAADEAAVTAFDPTASVVERGERTGTLRIVGLLTLAAFILAVLPLWIYGFTTIIGENWDAEIYMALGEYLKAVPQNALASVTPNPLLNTLLVPPYSLRTHGFSYFQAALSGLLLADSIDTLNPVLALLHALEVPAAFVFLRGLWGWRAAPALWAAGLLALNPFLLWISYNTFGMQVPALGLLIAASAVALAALRAAGTEESRARDWLPGAIGAGLLAAGLAVTYHPALTAWAAVCGLGWLAVLVERRAAWRRLLTAGVVVVLSGGLLSAVAQWLSLQGFISQYAEQVGGLGLTGFTLPGDALGLSLSFRELLSVGPNQPLLALAANGYRALTLLALACAAGLGLLWVWGEARRRADGWLLRLATLAAGLIYMLAFLWPLRYPYGWFKAQSFMAFLLVGAVVGGAWRLLGRPLLTDEDEAARRVWRRPLALAGLALPAVPALALLATLALTLWMYRSPIRYDEQMLAVAQVRQWVQSGDPVLLSDSSLMPGRLFNGLASYYLRGADVYGEFNTANATWDRARPDGAYRWAILNSKETPEVYGYSEQDRVWGNDLLALYRRPATVLYHADWDAKGDYPDITMRSPLHLYVGAAQTSVLSTDNLAPAPSGVPAPRKLTLGLASFTTLNLSMIVESPALAASGAPTITLAYLQAGLQSVSITVTSQSTITILPRPDMGLSAEAFVRWVTLERADRREPLPPSVDGALVPGVTMLSLSTANVLPEIRNVLKVAVGRKQTAPFDRVVLDIWKRGGSVHPDDHLGYWAFQRDEPTMRFGVRPESGVPTAINGATPIPDQSWVGTIAAGRYVASISLYSGDHLIKTVTDIYTFTLDQASATTRSFTRTQLRVSALSIRSFPILFY